ncbi:hypothetical protein Pcinc_022959 [Petrolisthes cinctipes]|uniref:Uncharacterized protein n=1 Tax=Petrolisthes cinctipes TaxID=88211 RepID=A0AAE1FFB1_PETCI|nr:hypothetical protein Pcinc_022959 [Petrolisthes cinctipes]
MVAESTQDRGRNSRLTREKMSRSKQVGQTARETVDKVASSISAPSVKGKSVDVTGSGKVSDGKCASKEYNKGREERGSGGRAERGSLRSSAAAANKKFHKGNESDKLNTSNMKSNNRKRPEASKTSEEKQKFSSNRDTPNTSNMKSNISKKSEASKASKEKQKSSSDRDKTVNHREKSKRGKLSPGNSNMKATVVGESSLDDTDIDFADIEKKIFEGVNKRDSRGKRCSGEEGKDGSKSNTKREKTTVPKKPDALGNKADGNTPTQGSQKKKQHTDIKKHRSNRSGEAQKKEKMQTVEKSSIARSGKEIKKTRSEVGRSGSGSKSGRKQSRGRRKTKADVAGSESDMSDWEEVEEKEMVGTDEAKELLEEYGATQLKKEEGVKIELDAPQLWGMNKRKKRTQEEMIEDYLRKRVNRSIKEVYENMHKTHLLCLLAHGRYLNQALNSEVLLAAALSIVVDKNAYPPKRLDLNYLQKFVSWFGRKITMTTETLEKDYWSKEVSEVLAGRYESKTARSCREFVLMFVVICRALGMNVRLILAPQPLGWKPGAEVLIKKGKTPGDEEKEETGVLSEVPHTQASTSKAGMKVNKGRKMLSSDSDVDTLPSKHSGKKGQKHSKSKEASDEDWDSDFDPSEVKKKKGPKSLSSQKRKSNEKKRKSTDGEGDRGGGKRRKVEEFLEWAEVYVEEEEKWICVDVVRGKIHCIAEIETRMPSGSAYITAFSSNLTVKDVTRRYIASWLSSENKMRCDSKWWGKSLKAFRGPRTRLDKEEEQELDLNLREQPLPKSITEYKNHPLYALQRHMLKFQAIYPPNQPPIGYIKGEAVYPRESIHNLHSRDTWTKEAKSVRVDEQPYKTVKARPKWDRISCKVIKDLPLELFGEWQVEDYEPPVAQGGKVPRNDYGNVELFKPSMLPRGCVHIPITGLNKVAKKLSIDCAPAMVGFDFHSGWTHPVYDGYVVCEEFKDVLMDAWNEEQAEQARREEEKREKRIYDNWKKLIKGMIVRARVREDYKRESDEEDTEKQSKPKSKKITQADIDAQREDINVDSNQSQEDKQPTNITHPIKNLRIDFTSDVVEMAKKSRAKAMHSKNAVKKVVKKREGGKKQNVKEKKAGELEELSDEVESDQEHKKEKIRAILNWSTSAVTSNPDLSDDSETENEPQSSSRQPQQLSNPFFASIINPTLKRVKKEQGKIKSKSYGEMEESGSDSLSSRSTTPEPETSTLNVPKARRLSSRRSVQKKTKTYLESESDISLDSSDCEDRSYNPRKEKP